MENTLVSARVPRAKKERGGSVLASINATTSDLINSAFDYVIATKELPRVDKPSVPAAKDFLAFRKQSTFEVDWPADFKGDYKELAANLRKDAYEALD